MMTALTIVLVVAVLAIVISFIIKSNTKKSLDESSKHHCDQCDVIIPEDYMKSLCPQCKAFIAR